MKALVLLATITLMSTICTATSGTCPDGRACDGECCQFLPLMRIHWCCRGIFKCKSTFGIGYCFVFSEPKTQTLTDSAESEENTPEVSHEESDEIGHDVGKKSDDPKQEILDFADAAGEISDDSGAFAEAVMDVFNEMEGRQH